MRTILIPLALTALTLAAAPLEAGSIYARAAGRSRSLYADDTARNVGDIVTIAIDEVSKVENASQRKLDKSTDRQGAMEGTFQVGDILASLRDRIFGFPKLDFQSSSDAGVSGSADYTRDRKVTDKITVTVEDVLPNGNLVVLGKRRRRIDGDLQTVQVSGIIRPSDINFSNEVSSQKVADFHVVYSACGQEEDYLNPGWLERILAYISPF